MNSATPMQHADPMLLVLPFTAPAGDDAAYLAEGVSDELVMALSQVAAIRVISRGTAATFRTRVDAPIDRAASLGADLVVWGTVEQEGDRLHVHAAIAGARLGHERWIEDLRVAPCDFTAAVARLGERVLSALGVVPTPGWSARVARPITGHPEALDLILRGRYHTEQRPIGVKPAMQCFDRAIRLDGSVAQAFGALAFLWANFGIFLALPPQQAAELAREQLQRALAIDPHEPWARVALLTVHAFYDWDLARVDAEGGELLADFPSFVAPRQVLLYAQAARGRLAEVRALAAEVHQLDPGSVDPVNDAAFALLLCGRADEAVALLDAHVQLHPTASEVHRRLGLALLEVGEPHRAVTHLERSVALSRRHVWGIANLACARAGAGDGDGARVLLAELEERADGELVPAVALAELHASLGDGDAALAHLDRAFDARDYWLLALDVDPLLAPLRNDPRFAALRARRDAPRPA